MPWSHRREKTYGRDYRQLETDLSKIHHKADDTEGAEPESQDGQGHGDAEEKQAGWLGARARCKGQAGPRPGKQRGAQGRKRLERFS